MSIYNFKDSFGNTKLYNELKSEIIELLANRQICTLTVSLKKPILKNNVNNIVIYDDIDNLKPIFKGISNEKNNFDISNIDFMEAFGLHWLIIS